MHKLIILGINLIGKTSLEMFLLLQMRIDLFAFQHISQVYSRTFVLIL